MDAATLEQFKQLDQEKKRLEEEITKQQEFLTMDGMPGVSGSLLDGEGFPRADLDIYAIRKARNALACAQTDHVEVMKKIEQALFAIHAGSCVSVPRPKAAGGDDGACEQDSAETNLQLLPPPFALIDEVFAGSPAEAAGLVVGDHIYQFGDISRHATGDLNACFAAVQRLVPEKVGTPIKLLVLRGQPQSKVALQLVPQQWPGRGLIGCHMAPKV
mmetsp:Transcript_22367/g.62781  ORF Transcript_22367/g.62781 Transcript_22367/m.62781 type:complete len:216 (+) Transcript_22367:62-709(+)